jgi:hypothetical protein
MRRWTLIVIIVLFVGLAVAATLQFTAGNKQVRCPGPHAHFGGPSTTVRCVSPTPSHP